MMIYVLCGGGRGIQKSFTNIFFQRKMGIYDAATTLSVSLFLLLFSHTFEHHFGIVMIWLGFNAVLKPQQYDSQYAIQSVCPDG